jgi:hypothetical protein
MGNKTVIKKKKYIPGNLFMGAAIIDFRVCPPLVKCQNIMFSGFIDTLMYGFSSTGVTIYCYFGLRFNPTCSQWIAKSTPQKWCNINFCCILYNNLILYTPVTEYNSNSWLTPHSTIFQLYHWWSVLLVEETGILGEKTTTLMVIGTDGIYR